MMMMKKALENALEERKIALRKQLKSQNSLNINEQGTEQISFIRIFHLVLFVVEYFFSFNFLNVL